jgi:hypothetical protein
MKTIALLATFTLGCLTACASSSSDDGTNAGGNAYSANTPSKSSPAPSASGKAAAPTKAPAAQTPTPPDLGPTSPAAKGGSVAIDGTTCTLTSTGLDTGLAEHGWTLAINGHCPMEFTISISGTSDGAYPQTTLTPFVDQSAAYLALTTPEDNNDFSPFEATESRIDRGPTTDAPATVSGSATVTNAADGTTHNLTYALDY